MTDSILSRIQNELKDAMRAKDKPKLETLRLITAAIKQIEVDERITVTDERLLVILDKMVKQRKESIEQFSQANRTDLVEKEQFQLDIIQTYLPTPLTDDEISVIIRDTMTSLGAKTVADMGKVMASIKPQVQGRADMAKISVMIKSQLA